jgi:uncharacterized membrane protein YbhN (UPF0104 family)
MSRWRTLGHLAALLTALGYLAWEAPDFARSLALGTARLGSTRWTWVGLAACAALAGLALYGELHRRLLLVAGVHIERRVAQGIHFAGNALANTVPVVGGAAAIAYAINRLRRRGVDGALASWSTLLAATVSTLVLLVLGAIALTTGGRLPLAVGVPLIVSIPVATAGAWAAVAHPSVLPGIVRLLLLVGQRVPWLCPLCRSRWATDATAISVRVSARLDLLRPTSIEWLSVVSLAALKSGVDYLSLSACATAAGASAPIAVLAEGLLIVEASIALQILPGGAGLADAGLLGVLLAAGTGSARAATTVLLYRGISWLGVSVVGWLVYIVQVRREPPHRHLHTRPQPRPLGANPR